MRIILLALLLGAVPMAFADQICNQGTLTPKIKAELESNLSSVSGQITPGSYKITPFMPGDLYKQLGEPKTIVVFEMSVADEDGTKGEPQLWAAQFAIDYKTCTPAYLLASILQEVR